MSITSIRLQRRSLAAMVAGVALITGSPAQAASSAIFTPISGLALDGYDTVAFFTQGRPVRGDARFESIWQGARWRFSTQDHLNRFLAEPARFAPQYGGYCAWAVGARKALAAGDARYWRSVGGTLYVNFDASVRAQWVRDIPGFILAADRNWPAILTR